MSDNVRTIDLFFLALLLWILGDVADPERHVMALGITTHAYYTVGGGLVLIYAGLRPTRK